MDVGVTDAIRAEESGNGITNISEFDSHKNAAEFPALLNMSTYQQIKDGTAYPSVIFIHGLARQGASTLADVYSFLLWQFGKTASKP